MVFWSWHIIIVLSLSSFWSSKVRLSRSKYFFKSSRIYEISIFSDSPCRIKYEINYSLGGLAETSKSETHTSSFLLSCFSMGICVERSANLFYENSLTSLLISTTGVGESIWCAFEFRTPCKLEIWVSQNFSTLSVARWALLSSKFKFSLGVLV